MLLLSSSFGDSALWVGCVYNTLVDSVFVQYNNIMSNVQTIYPRAIRAEKKGTVTLCPFRFEKF